MPKAVENKSFAGGGLFIAALFYRLCVTANTILL
jgi:hypothetical protein